ncbi:hypothetical protein C5167_028376 [Papaver somniferum]|nr:hypothetical protein C5167_028376 [Papaver somniferum]
MNAYERRGWSEDQIQTAFRKSPHCMMVSPKKITAVMDFLVNETGYDSLSIVGTPKIFSNSLKERIVPRCSGIRIFVRKGLMKGKIPLWSLVVVTDKSFLDKFMKPYGQEAPALMKSSITSKSKEQNSLIAPKDPKLIIPAVEPPKFCSPRPVSELDAAAVKLKSYGTRRNLPDCAVVVEALW